MQHRTRRRALFAIVVGGSLFVSAALILACGNRDLTDIPLADPNDPDSGSTTKKDAGKTNTDGAPTDDPDTGGADCSAAPYLRSNDNGFYCAFFTRDGGTEDASRNNCTADETCCNPGKGASSFPPSFCATTPKASKGQTDQAACTAQAAANGSQWIATGGTTWECGDSNNCAAGQVCCMFTQPGLAATDKANVGPNLNKTIPPACAAKQAFKYGGTYCAASCGATDIQMCSATDNNCAPKRCVPFEVFPGGRNLGSCN